MTRFSAIAPLPVQRQIDPFVFGGYNLLLAHKILEDQQKWHDYYQMFRRTVGETFIIMDNSLWELGHPLEPAQLIEAAQTVGASCIVLPDKLRWMTDTIRMSREAIEKTGPLPDGMSWMLVTQGTDISQVVKCAEFFCRHYPDEVKYFSVPRVVADKNTERSRWLYLQALQGAGVSGGVHLLGFSEHVKDDLICVNHPIVMGIDSAMPVWFGCDYGMLPIHRPEHGLDVGKRPKDFWEFEDLKVTQLRHIHANIQRVREWIRQCGVWMEQNPPRS